MSGGISAATIASVAASAVGVIGSIMSAKGNKPQQAAPAPVVQAPTPMPDTDQSKARRMQEADAQKRRGRLSSILTEGEGVGNTLG